MPLPDSFTVQEVNDAIADLNVCIDDATKCGIFQKLEETHLPRLAHILTQNKVFVEMLNELPKAHIQDLLDCIANDSFDGTDFPIEPKARLSEQLAILILSGNGKIDLWDFTDKFFRRNGGSKFWDEIFFPATRDLMRYAVSQQKHFNDRKKLNKTVERQKINMSKNYSLDLFISHSSKDKQLAKSLIEFLCTALAIPHERVRCTSVNGYKLSAGAKTESVLQKEIRKARCFIGLITPDSLKSQFVLFELGARWGTDEHLVPILGNGIKTRALRPPLSNLNALNSACESEMEQLVHDLAKILEKNVPLPTIYKSQLSLLVEAKPSKTQERKAMRPAKSVKQKQPAPPSRPDWHKFVSDEIFGVFWRWSYSGNSINDHLLAGFCPKQGCMNRLEIDFDPQNPHLAGQFHTLCESMVCHRCGFKHHFDCDRESLQRRVIHEIERLINTGQYMARLKFRS